MIFLGLKTNNTNFKGKKQVGEQVEKSPELRKYRLYKKMSLMGKKIRHS